MPIPSRGVINLPPASLFGTPGEKCAQFFLSRDDGAFGIALGDPNLPWWLWPVATESGLMPAGNGATFLHGGFADALPYLQAVVYLKRHEKHR